MKRTKRQMACVAVALSLAAGVAAQRVSVKLPPDNAVAQLKRGTGAETVSKNCSICHSTDYIVRQPSFDASRWKAEVAKMIKIFGAPISDSDAEVIADYLSRHYGSAQLTKDPKTTKP